MKRVYTLLILLGLGIGILAVVFYRATNNPIPTNQVSQTQSTTTPIYSDFPKDGDKLASPATIHGKARGTWFFEASFPIVLMDENGTVIARGPAHAQGKWMTEEYVPYTLTLTFTKPTSATGKLILKKDNPSGDPSRDASLEIPVTF